MKKIVSIIIAVMAVLIVGFNPIMIKEGTCYGVVVHNFPKAYNACFIEVFEEKFENREIVNWEYWSDEELKETLKEQYALKRITRLEYDGDHYTDEELLCMMTK